MAAWHAGTSHDIVECPMCHVYMAPRRLDEHLSTKHPAVASLRFPVPPTPKPPTVHTPPSVLKLPTPALTHAPRPPPVHASPPVFKPPTPAPTPPPVFKPSPTPTPTAHTALCPFCKAAVSQSRTRKNFIKHMKIHTTVTCGLCFSNVVMESFTDHTAKCRIANNGTLTCPLCSNALASKPNKHFKTHITKLVCPFPRCPSCPFESYDNHMATHFDKLVKEQNLFSKKTSTSSEKYNPQTPKSAFSTDSFFRASRDSGDFADILPNLDKLDAKSRTYVQITHQCPVCNSPNLHEGEFESHLQSCLTSQPNPTQCPNCSRKESNITTLIRHIHHNHFRKLYTCHGCLNTIPCFLIRSHPIQCLGGPPFQPTKQQKGLLNSKNISCPVCSKQCSKTQVSSHILSHVIFTCPSCPWLSNRLNDFTPHVFNCITTAKSSRNMCPVCTKTFSKTKLSEHILNEHSHQCPICNRAMSKNELSFHGLVCTITHQNATTAKAPPTKQNSTFAPSPGPTLNTSQSLNITDTHVTAVSESSKFSCSFCHSLQTGDLNTIRSHLRTCVIIQANSKLEIVDTPDLVGLKIN